VQECLFCEILDGAAEGSFAYRDDVCAVLADIFPANDGHLLVVPIEHAAHLDVLSPRAAGHLMKVAREVVAALRASTLRCEGFNIALADGAVAGQDVFHTHLHVIPRFEGDGFPRRFFPRDRAPRPREELDRVTKELREHLAPG
jgi:histidine triad (HIT) family protein